VKAVAEKCHAAQGAVLVAEHVRHYRDDSGERDEPNDESRNPPPHFSSSLICSRADSTREFSIVPNLG
jgi:hypothetical protein